jgi:Uncharacterized protein conserved in bacteria
MSKPIVIEKIKNLAIVVLFISTVLLLYFFWGNSINGNINNQNDQNDANDRIVEVIKPERLVVYFGSDNYTVIPDGDTNIWKNSGSEKDINMVGELKRFGQSDILVKEITDKEYQEVMKYDKSICAEFAYDIPLTDFCSHFGIKKQQSYDAIEDVTEVGYSTAYAESIFIRDKKNHKYYQLYSDKDHTRFKKLISTIKTKGYSPYYPLSTYLGVENDTLVPLSVESNMRSFSYQQDAYVHQTEEINKFAKSFFGKNFDFIRKITENDGTVIYMYGYGQRVLIVNTDGSFEYKQEQISNGTEQSMSEALITAVNFIQGHGSWESLSRASMTPYLKNVIADPDKKGGYRFVFGTEINGSRLFYEQGNAVVIDVSDGQVSYYKRNLISFDQDEVNSLEAASYDSAFSPVNLIAQNYGYIYDILLKEGIVKESADQPYIFEDIAKLITNMQTGYIKAESKKNDDRIKPVWVVSISNIDIFFDLYKAEPIGYSAE